MYFECVFQQTKLNTIVILAAKIRHGNNFLQMAEYWHLHVRLSDTKKTTNAPICVLTPPSVYNVFFHFKSQVLIP